MSRDYQCRIPRAGEWVRVNPNPEYSSEVVVVMHQGDYWLLTPEVVEKIEKTRNIKMERSRIFVAQNREGENFLWPVVVPVPEHHMALQAMHEWVCFPLVQ
jgi:hypothetical protein